MPVYDCLIAVNEIRQEIYEQSSRRLGTCGPMVNGLVTSRCDPCAFANNLPRGIVKLANDCEHCSWLHVDDGRSLSGLQSAQWTQVDGV